MTWTTLNDRPGRHSANIRFHPPGSTIRTSEKSMLVTAIQGLSVLLLLLLVLAASIISYRLWAGLPLLARSHADNLTPPALQPEPVTVASSSHNAHPIEQTGDTAELLAHLARISELTGSATPMDLLQMLAPSPTPNHNNTEVAMVDTQVFNANMTGNTLSDLASVRDQAYLAALEGIKQPVPDAQQNQSQIAEAVAYIDTQATDTAIQGDAPVTDRVLVVANTKDSNRNRSRGISKISRASSSQN